MSLVHQPKRSRGLRGRTIENQLLDALKAQTAAMESKDTVALDTLRIRIAALQRIQGRRDHRVKQERKDKLAAALIEVERLTQENAKLRQDLATRATKPLTPAEIALQNYEKENGGANG